MGAGVEVESSSAEGSWTRPVVGGVGRVCWARLGVLVGYARGGEEWSSGSNWIFLIIIG